MTRLERSFGQDQKTTHSFLQQNIFGILLIDCIFCKQYPSLVHSLDNGHMSYLLGITEWTFILAITHSFPLARCDLFFLIFLCNFYCLFDFVIYEIKSEKDPSKKNHVFQLLFLLALLGRRSQMAGSATERPALLQHQGPVTEGGGRAAEQPRVAGAKGEAACAFNQVAFLRARGVCVCVCVYIQTYLSGAIHGYWSRP